MKTKALILFCLIAISAVFAVNVQAQAIKGEYQWIVGVDEPPLYLPCTGDNLTGTITVEYTFMQNNMLFKVKKGTLTGSPSGKVYTAWSISPGMNNFVAMYSWKCEGKLVATDQIHYHQTINANGEVTVMFFRENLTCH